MPLSTLILSVSALLSTLSTPSLAAKYALSDNYSGNTFFDAFDFFDSKDPANGFVKYVDRVTAQQMTLIKQIGGDNYMGVDITNQVKLEPGSGRPSVRIESKKTYNKGLFIVDLKHMPGSVCGTWPTFWSVGGGAWPTKGAINIISGVNQGTFNKFVVHTDTQCKVDGKGQTGFQGQSDCALDGPSRYSGCDVSATEDNTYGDGFNANGGGVYAMEWTSQAIKVWFFPRGKIPASITAEKPDTDEFGIPNANFAGACDIDKRFVDHKLIFNTDFCGDWAGNVYAQTSCPMYGTDGGSSCARYVAENPGDFKESFWQFSYFKTFSIAANTSSSSSAVSSLQSSSLSSSPTRSLARSFTGSFTGTGSRPTGTGVRGTGSRLATGTGGGGGFGSSSVLFRNTTFGGNTGTPITSSPARITTPAGNSSAGIPDVIITKTNTVTYIDVCSTGYVTVTTTITMPCNGGCSQPYTTTQKACPIGCGSTSTNVIVTVPATRTNFASTVTQTIYSTILSGSPPSSSSVRTRTGSRTSSWTGSRTIAWSSSSSSVPVVSVPPAQNPSTATRVVTIPVVPVPVTSLCPGCPPSVPSSAPPNPPVSGSNATSSRAAATTSYGTVLVTPPASKTSSPPSLFTGGAASLKDTVVFGGAFAALFALLL